MTKINPNSNEALIVVDIQNDFCEGGALEVPDASKIIDKSNKLINIFDQVILTQDWHPYNHISFASQHKGKKPFDIIEVDYGKQTLWPEHCIQGTYGADFHRNLITKAAKLIIRKGYNKNIDSYSAFFENDKYTCTGLKGYINEKKINKVYFLGLALDVCVKDSALDSKNSGLDTYVFEDLCKGLSKQSSDNAIDLMNKSKIKIIDSNKFI
ncbi:MAG: nicotinamidase/pyrazinamidase [Rhodospirillaceae bacterium]|nr:nicotinamidase/pyrazinamidase [Rhodospirillaceae bacterium]|tara:strand:- start:1838 stop:2470 length:633 start_codon:yes stop_codon:yes gene_type:complete